MKIVTYNINGLRPRVAQYGSLLRLLNSLDADIICFQETKITRQDLSVDLTTAEGYEAFVSCSRSSSKTRGGYSGVATFCRVTSAFSSQEVALPVTAEEGFTGLLEGPKISDKELPEFSIEVPLKIEGFEEVITKEEILKLDSEGRCVITDHGHFVLFNIYGPRAEAEDKERIRFKLLFFKILQKRWEFLLNLGKRVVVVGDFNIAPFAIDRCDADADFEKNMFRKWLRSLLRNSGGCFYDVFRSKHPERKGVYTCFSQRIGAEEFNYGSRIDHILIAGPCIHEDHEVEEYSIFDCHVTHCDILTEFKRGSSDTLSKWNGGRSTKLEGSDHIPVYVKLTDIPDLPVHSTPALAVRYLPEVRGWQQSIVSFLSKSQSLQQKEVALNLSSETSSELSSSQQNQGYTTARNQEKKQFFAKRKSPHSIKDTKRAKGSSSSQLTIKSFFKQPGEEPSFSSDQNFSDEVDICNSQDVICSKEKGNAALLEWQRIQERMKTSLPLCKGHREPCVARSVKKGGNIGRLFYVCARAQGPATNPEANCNHFQWASYKSKDKK
ncbi:DNA-(Apurinic or apyrimidinic site) lyase 2 [Rhynchospora pubera]|uniref:DNA-(apurinic or apyrimidinic site) endonuclease 2 n=1 Tax=Rhynchospora pubera TaxID=906938 RepID=A0AAV8EY12_9POAL|nr:DNA-(Apurinic or apyrimidinic site) lyase 2 [Rhynchospora pubera]